VELNFSHYLISILQSLHPTYTTPTITSIIADSYPYVNWAIRPGQTVKILGGKFGPTQGTVRLNIAPFQTVELEIQSWSDTQIRAKLSNLISSVNPYYDAGIWITDSGDTDSNLRSITFKPIYHHWLSYSTIAASGGVFGNSHDGVFCNGKQLQDHFWVYTVGHKHDSLGWSELRSPWASGANLRQGYHWGASTGQNGSCVLIYHVIGPKGFTPKHSIAVQGWAFGTVLPLDVDYPANWFG